MTPRSALAALVAVIWGLCFVIIQASLPAPAPLLLAGLRALVGGAVLASWVILTRWPERARLSRGRSFRSGSWRQGLPSKRVMVLLALANATVAFGSMYLAAGRAEAAVASILAGGQPVVLAAAGWVLFGERTSARSGAGLAIAIAGVVMVATTSSGATSPDGVGLALLATTAPAVGTVLMRRLGSSVDLVLATSLQFLIGGAILLGVSALLEPWADLSWSPATLSGLLVLGVIGTGVAYVVWFWLLKHVSLVGLGAALFLVPVVGVVSGILTGDRPQPIELAGIAAMLAGFGLISVRRETSPAVKPIGRG
ncbi:MAG TPA: DMT family transporter [Candidatus Limnocylindrales bacterium]